MARVLRILNWLIHRLTEQYDKLEEPVPAPLPRAKAKLPDDEHQF
jgi:hypothetical protein